MLLLTRSSPRLQGMSGCYLFQEHRTFLNSLCCNVVKLWSCPSRLPKFTRGRAQWTPWTSPPPARAPRRRRSSHHQTSRRLTLFSLFFLLLRLVMHAVLLYGAVAVLERLFYRFVFLRRICFKMLFREMALTSTLFENNIFKKCKDIFHLKVFFLIFPRMHLKRLKLQKELFIQSLNNSRETIKSWDRIENWNIFRWEAWHRKLIFRGVYFC